MTGFGSWFDDIDADERAEQEEELNRLRDTYARYERPLARAIRDASRRALPVTTLGDPDSDKFVEARIQRLIEQLRDFATNPDRPARHDEDPRPRSEPRERRERSSSDNRNRPAQVRVMSARQDEIEDDKNEDRVRSDRPSRDARPPGSSNNDRGKTGDSDSRPDRDKKTKRGSGIWNHLKS
jgi:hypothetical protein